MNQISRGYDSESPDYRSGSRMIYYDTVYPVAKPANEYGFVYQTYTRTGYQAGIDIDYSPVKEKVEYLKLFIAEFME